MKVKKNNEDRLFLGSTPTSKILLNMLSATSGILTIWGFITAQKNSGFQKILTIELIDEWNSELESLHNRIDDIKLSLHQVACHLDSVNPRAKTISQACLQYNQPHRNRMHSPVLIPAISKKQTQKNINYFGEKKMISNDQTHQLNTMS